MQSAVGLKRACNHKREELWVVLYFVTTQFQFWRHFLESFVEESCRDEVSSFLENITTRKEAERVKVSKKNILI